MQKVVFIRLPCSLLSCTEITWHALKLDVLSWYSCLSTRYTSYTQKTVVRVITAAVTWNPITVSCPRTLLHVSTTNYLRCRSWWQSGLRRRSVSAWLLGMDVRFVRWPDQRFRGILTGECVCVYNCVWSRSLKTTRFRLLCYRKNGSTDFKQLICYNVTNTNNASHMNWFS